jgi:hypothetical protein
LSIKLLSVSLCLSLSLPPSLPPGCPQYTCIHRHPSCMVWCMALLCDPPMPFWSVWLPPVLYSCLADFSHWMLQSADCRLGKWEGGRAGGREGGREREQGIGGERERVCEFVIHTFARKLNKDTGALRKVSPYIRNMNMSQYNIFKRDATVSKIEKDRHAYLVAILTTYLYFSIYPSLFF